MGEAKPPPDDAALSQAEAMALLEEAEAEAAEAEALAAAARARARVARLRREVQGREVQGEAPDKIEAAEADSAESHEAAATDVTEVVSESESGEDEAAEGASTETADDQSPDADESDADESDADEPDDEVAEDEAAEETTEEDEEDKEDEDADEAAAPEPRRPRRFGATRRLPSPSATFKVATIILICAFVCASGYMVWDDHNATERRQRAAKFIAGAKQGVVNMASLDFHRAKEDVQRLLDSSTGQFRDDFQQRANDFVTVVEQSQVVTQGTINAAAVESMGEHSALVLVSATSSITNAAGAKDEPRVWRLRVTVTEEGGQYKMSKLEFVP